MSAVVTGEQPLDALTSDNVKSTSTTWPEQQYALGEFDIHLCDRATGMNYISMVTVTQLESDEVMQSG